MQVTENDGTDSVGYGVDFPVFWIDRFHPHGVMQHTAFAAKNRAEVDALHATALKAAGLITARLGFEMPSKVTRRATMPPSCLIRTATT
jgi:hypothetical protein